MSKTDSFAIQVKGLSKKYRHEHDGVSGKAIPALTDVSFNVNVGDSLGIIGENGSGKSTLLKILSGVIQPSNGEVLLQGKVVSVLDIGSGFHPDLTGKENVILTGRILGMGEGDIVQRLPQIISFSGIEDFMDTPVKYYSSGMYLRLAFSLVIHMEADIFVFDEVMSVGDNEFQLKSIEQIKNLHKQGKTIVFASHSLDIISRVCNKSIMLNKGSVIAYGKTADVILEYMSGSVQKYVDALSVSESLSEDSTEEQGVAHASGNGHKTLRRNSIVWGDTNAPGDSNLVIKAVRLFNQENSTQLKSEDVINIEVSYEKKSTTPTMLCFMFTYNLTTPVFIANPFLNTKSSYSLEKSPGSYRLQCSLPPFLLNNGVFSLDIFALTENDEELFNLRNVLVFTVHYHESYMHRLNYDGGFPGGLMPVLDWKIEKL